MSGLLLHRWSVKLWNWMGVPPRRIHRWRSKTSPGQSAGAHQCLEVKEENRGQQRRLRKVQPLRLERKIKEETLVSQRTNRDEAFQERMVSCVNIVRESGGERQNWKVTTGSGNKAVLGDLDTYSLSGLMRQSAPGAIWGQHMSWGAGTTALIVSFKSFLL